MHNRGLAIAYNRKNRLVGAQNRTTIAYAYGCSCLWYTTKQHRRTLILQDESISQNRAIELIKQFVPPRTACIDSIYVSFDLCVCAFMYDVVFQ